MVGVSAGQLPANGSRARASIFPAVQASRAFAASKPRVYEQSVSDFLVDNVPADGHYLADNLVTHDDAFTHSASGE
ncbi:hypothetical protein GCM10009715_12100 [Paeniglutamicibacter psychrophenolicus]